MGDIRVQILAYVEAMWRRRWLAVVIAWLVCVVGWALVLTIPNQYQSQARIYVNTNTLGPLLKGIALDGNLGQQVAIMQRTLLSRPNLEQVARMTNLDVTATTPAQWENLLGQLAERTAISGGGRSSLFAVQFVDKDPILAKNVVQALLTIFVENNLGVNRAEMENARSFIGDQILVYEKQLRTAEARRAEFQQKNAAVLAGQGRFINRLEGARGRLFELKLTYEGVLAKRAQLKKQLLEVPQLLEVESTAAQIIIGGRVTPISALLARIQELQQSLDSLLLRFTDQHPDVIATQRALDRLVQQYEREQTATPRSEAASAVPRTTTKIPNPLYDEIKLKLVDTESEVVTLQRRLQQANTQAERLEAMTKTAPRIEAQLSDLNRDYGVIQAKYEDLLVRREAARLAEAVKAKSDNIQFRIIDPPQVPSKPIAPNRQLFMIAVLFVGVGAGIGFAFLLVQLDDSFQTPGDLKRAFGLPVLGAVSALISAPQRTRRVVGNVAFGTACVSLVAVFGGLMVLLPQLVEGLVLPAFVRGFI